MRKFVFFALWSILFLIGCKKEDPKTIPTVNAREITELTGSAAKGGGEIISDGGMEVTSRGVCWSRNPNPTLNDDKTSDGSGSGSFNSSIQGLVPGVTYYLKAYAINVVGIAYSGQLSFSAATLLAQLTTVSPTGVQVTSVTLGGNITSDGGASVTERGVCWSTSQNPTINDHKISQGQGSGTFECTASGLNPSTTYYFRAYATNATGTSYGNIYSTTTKPLLPTITSAQVSNLTATKAIAGGNIGNDGTAVIYSRGVCWSTSHNPSIMNERTTDGTGIGAFISNLTGLAPQTTYYIRSYGLTNAADIYGEELSLTTPALSGETVSDNDGNVYHTVTIGNQVWMMENLRTTKFRNGDPIAKNAYYQNKPSYFSPRMDQDIPVFGAVYNVLAIKDSRNLAPVGWHIPSEEEWNTMINYLGGSDVAGGKLKQRGNISRGSGLWFTNAGATNESDFTALPSGYLSESGGLDFGYSANFWTSTVYDISNQKMICLKGENAKAILGRLPNTYSCSIRCIKD